MTTYWFVNEQLTMFTAVLMILQWKNDDCIFLLLTIWRLLVTMLIHFSWRNHDDLFTCLDLCWVILGSCLQQIWDIFGSFLDDVGYIFGIIVWQMLMSFWHDVCVWFLCELCILFYVFEWCLYEFCMILCNLVCMSDWS